MKVILYTYVLFIIGFSNSIIGQELDSISAQSIDTIPNAVSIPFSMQIDSFSVESDSTLLPYKLSKNALDSEVTINAGDSSWVDLVNNKKHVYGNAEVEYENIKLTADYIIINFKENLIEGFWLPKSNSKPTDIKPTFTESDRKFTYNEIKYNFKTKKGLVKHAVTKEDEFYLLGEKSKFIGATLDSTGVVIEDDKFYNEDVVVTTCNHDPPHFGIRTNKLKFVPNKLAVMSVAQLEIAGVPTPIFLPFGFFPLAKGRSSGLIFPTFDYQERLGFVIRKLGYYHPINNNLDANITVDFSTRGYFLSRLSANYNKLYAFTGQSTLEFSNQISENAETGKRTSSKSFSINVVLNQGAKAHPYRKLGGSINISSGNHFQNNYSDSKSQTKTEYTSAFTYSHSMPRTPFSFNMGLNHRQNIITHDLEITLPSAQLNMNTIYPFKRANSTEEKWSDKIAFVYKADFRNYVKTVDSTLFTQNTIDKLQTGLWQNASLNTSVRLLKYFNINPNVTYNEYWLLKRYNLTFDPTAEIRDTITGDLIGYEAPQESYYNAFTSFRTFSAGVSLNTQIFGTLKFSKGYFKGFRHVMKPSISLNYSPENKTAYEQTVNTDTRDQYNSPITYSILRNGPFGSLNGTVKSLSIGYSVSNVFEMKYKAKSDTIAKKLRILNNLNFSGNYNFQADSLKWSPLTFNGNTQILKGITGINLSGMFSPYVYNSNDKITNTTLWSQSKKLLKLKNVNITTTTSFSLGSLMNLFKKKEKDSNSNDSDLAKKEEEPSEQTSLSSWFNSIQISHTLIFSYLSKSAGDTAAISFHAMNVSGNIKLSKNWDFNIGSIGYDFIRSKLTYPSFTFSRNLHCWKLTTTWAPNNGYYAFFIGVNSSSLEFLKYNYNQGVTGFR
ncbi:MAG: putative LPS assembly protein LptD [Saprospiraceae bacterium]